MRRAMGSFFLLLAVAAPSRTSDEIPKRPEELRYEPLRFAVPRGEQFRHQLPRGAVAYVVPDHTLPLVDLGVVVRAGAFLEPEGKAGLALLAGALLPNGGTAVRSPEQLDERSDALAAEVRAAVGATSATVSIDCLAAVFGECADLFFELLREPAYQESRLALERANLLERLRQRNDDAEEIAEREWSWLLYGEEHWSTREPTAASLAAITRADLLAFHRDALRPEQMIFVVSGDLVAEDVLARLARGVASLPENGGAPVVWPPPPPRFVPRPGVYYVDKDIPQARVELGHLGYRYRWDDPDLFPLLLMNDILGGSGFTARITQRIRSDEGLAYSAGSRLGQSPYWPGDFAVFFQTKSASVARAAAIALEEIERMRREPVADTELAVAKSALVESFPRRFESAGAVVNLFATDQLLGRPHGYWIEYRSRIEAVTTADVQRVAQRYLNPDQVVLLVVGKWAEVEPGDPDGKATMARFYGGAATALPLRDPLTLQPLR